MSARYVCSAVSDVGCRRRLNEDACLSRPDLGLWVVADGMGGHQAGDHASRSIVEALDFPAEGSVSPRTLIDRIEDAMVEVNDRLVTHAQGLGPDAVVASTVVGLILAQTHFALFWLGDSRAYMVRGGAALQLTRDDSHVQALVDAGEIDEEAARSHPLSHVVTAAVGAGADFDLHFTHGRCGLRDRFVLCSDGLSNLVTPAETGRIASRTPIEEGAQTLVDIARARGAPDNVTVVVVGCDAPGLPRGGEEETRAGMPRGAEGP